MPAQPHTVYSPTRELLCRPSRTRTCQAANTAAAAAAAVALAAATTTAAATP